MATRSKLHSQAGNICTPIKALSSGSLLTLMAQTTKRCTTLPFVCGVAAETCVAANWELRRVIKDPSIEEEEKGMLD